MVNSSNMLTNFPNNHYRPYSPGMENTKFEKIENTGIESNLLKSPEPENSLEFSRKNSILQNEFNMDDFNHYDHINNNFNEQYPYFQSLQRPIESKEEMVKIIFQF